MAVSKEVVTALRCGKRIRIEMPECDGLKEGCELVRSIQRECNFKVVYTQRLGVKPEVIIWRSSSVEEAMREFPSGRLQA